MSLRKFCSPTLPAILADGQPSPLHCPSSPNCDHHWFYDFRVNRRRYRATTDTANKQEAKKIEAKERSRILDGRHGIRQQPDISFRTFAATYLDDYARAAQAQRRPRPGDPEGAESGVRFAHPARDHGPPDRAVQAGTAGGEVARPRPRRARRSRFSRRPSTGSSTPSASMFSKAVEWGKLLESPDARGEAAQGRQPAHPDSHARTSSARLLAGLPEEAGADGQAGAHHRRPGRGTARRCAGRTSETAI